jgi:hypothetical protein
MASYASLTVFRASSSAATKASKSGKPAEAAMRR